MVTLLPTIEVRLADGTECVVNESDFDPSMHSRMDVGQQAAAAAKSADEPEGAAPRRGTPRRGK